MEKTFFDQPVKNDKRRYNNIWKITNDHGVDYTANCFLGYIYFKEHYNLIAIGLSKQQATDAHPKAIR